MADILIRGMEMPQSCAVCKIRSYHAFCPINSRIKFFYDPSNKGFDFCSGIHPDCPLHELPEHGDLIDVNDTEKVLRKYADHLGPYKGEYEMANGVLKAVSRLTTIPVIVPADKEEIE